MNNKSSKTYGTRTDKAMKTVVRLEKTSLKITNLTINYLLKQGSPKYFSIIKQYFLMLLENDKLEKDYYYLDNIKHIIKSLSKEERKEVLHIVQRQKNCPPPEIEEIQNLINDLNLE